MASSYQGDPDYLEPSNNNARSSNIADISKIDIYSLRKPELIKLLINHGIYADDEDNQNNHLRPLASKLKALVTESTSNPIKREILRKVLCTEIPLPDHEKLIYPEFAELHSEVIARKQRYLQSQESGDEIYQNLETAIYKKLNLEPKFNLPALADLQSPSRGVQKPFVFPSSPIHNSNPQEVKMPQENLPLITAGSFSGLPSENVNDFLEHYVLAAESNNWHEDTKLTLFPTHLQNSAKIWFNLYKKRNPNPRWDDLQQEFRKAFTYAAQADSLSAIMQKKTQNKNEPVLNFFLDVVSTCKRYNPDIPDKDIIRYFLQSVRPEYCTYLSTLKNEDLSELEVNLLKAERFVSLNSQNKERYEKENSYGKGFQNLANQAGLHHVTFQESDR